MGIPGRRTLGAMVIAGALCILGTTASFSAGLARAQSTGASSNTQTADSSSGSAAVNDYRAKLQAQLNDIEAQITAQQKILTATQAKSKSLQNTITILKAQIRQAQLAIRARTLNIQQLTASIQQKENKVFGLNSQLNAEKDSLAGIMREKAQLEDTSLIVALLSSKSLSSFFSDLDTFDQINAGLQKSFAQISSTTAVTKAEEAALETQREQESQLRQVQVLQQQQIKNQQAQENQLLADTKGQEAAYQKLIAKNQKTAAQIRAALFQLNGSAAIPFGKALDYANLAAKKTGIRPAFLLGIIAEESNLGENVGTGSYLTDMSPMNRPIFVDILKSLGLDPAQMPVSAKPWYGWGGAMGPAQFIPSTWALYAGYPKPSYQYVASKDRIGRLTGDTPPNPWNPEDAFMAAALYLTDSGAAAKTPAAEFRAAMCYLAGCGNVHDRSLQFYGDQVQCLELKYQQDIDTIVGTHEANAMEANALYYGQC